MTSLSLFFPKVAFRLRGRKLGSQGRREVERKKELFAYIMSHFVQTAPPRKYIPSLHCHFSKERRGEKERERESEREKEKT